MSLVVIAGAANVVSFLHVQKLLSDTFTRGSHHIVALVSTSLIVVRVSIVNHCRPLDLNHVLRLLGTVREASRCDVSHNYRLLIMLISVIRESTNAAHYTIIVFASLVQIRAMMTWFGSHCGSWHIRRRQN